MNNDSPNYILHQTPHYLCLIKKSSKNPFFVDFLSPKMIYRCHHASLKKEALARAMGLKHNTHPFIVDATAGFARDSFILACLGFEVTLLERSPIIYALVNDGITRALNNSEISSIIKKLNLIQTDAITWLKAISPKPDIIYLDPMFPERKKSALVKKEMQILQEIIGKDEDGESLLKIALACAKQRVVVKRPASATPIPGPEPSFSLKGTSSRFDIYLI